MKRIFLSTAILFLLQACAGSAPEPQPGMVVVQHDRSGEMQVVSDVDWNSYRKVILHQAPAEFRDSWTRDQQRMTGKPVREEDLARLTSGISGQFGKVLYEALVAAGYEVTREAGEGVMLISPSIVKLDIKDPGLERGSLTEGIVSTRGSMTIELVITDSQSGELLAAAWQNQSDPHEGDMESTASVSNTLAFRRMMQNHAAWLLEGLDKAR